MSTKFAPIYATLVLAYLKERIYDISAEQFDSNFKKYLEENFKRFLDDCFIVFTRTEEDLAKFHELINKLYPSIRFTLEKSKDRLAFLDTLVIKDSGKLHTDIYYKPTDSKQYLLYTSCHDLLQTTDTESQHNNCIPYVTTFNPHNPEIYPEIQKNKSLLLRSDRMKSIFARKKFLKSKRQPPNLKKTSYKGEIYHSPKPDLWVTKCKEPRWGLCKYIKEIWSFKLKGETFFIHSNLSCIVKRNLRYWMSRMW